MMLNKLKQAKQAGTFSISPNRDVYGELTLAGKDSLLYLRDKEFIHASSIPNRCICGVLPDLTKVTLIKCITRSDLCTHSRGKDQYCSASLFPHYAILGNKHISPCDKSITNIHFVIDDASTLFNDFSAFGTLLDASPFIEQIARANGFDHEITIGPNPEIQYFTGKREIFSAKSAIGKVSAAHNPSISTDGPDGVSMRNTIYVTITFNEAVTFEKSIEHTIVLLRFFELIIGRPQNLTKIDLEIDSNEGHPEFLEVHWSIPPQRDSQHKTLDPHPSSLLIDAARQPDEFSQILSSWLERHITWQDARARFFNSFSNQRHYNIDRLVGAANMFDILPDSAVPPDVQLSEKLQSAKADCQKIFTGLPKSAERDSILSALGRLGKSALKHKIRHRSQHLLGLFRDIHLITDEAVNCRNHYVHGSVPRFDYSNNADTTIFFTSTLEFVFGTSDLVEAGWSITNWKNKSTTISHPFAEYRATYDKNLETLKALLKLTGSASQ